MDTRMLYVTIGLVMVFAVTSLFITALQEIWASWRNTRGANLKRAIASMGGDDFGFTEKLYEQPLVRSLYVKPSGPSYMPSDVFSKLFNYLEKGITFGSHTVPALALPPQGGSHRILHIHNNVPGVLSEINTRLSKNRINILGQYLKTNEEIGYVVLDVDKNISAHAPHLLREVKHTIKVRMLY